MMQSIAHFNYNGHIVKKSETTKMGPSAEQNKILRGTVQDMVMTATMTLLHFIEA